MSGSTVNSSRIRADDESFSHSDVSSASSVRYIRCMG